MRSNRSDIIDWSDQGRIPHDRLREALELAGVLPGAEDWRRFLDRALLFMGVAGLGAGAIFFFAFNWQDLGRYAKFALIEVPILALLAMVWHRGIDGLAGKAMLLLASLLVGALLALVGQTYQTGADTFELFAAWAAAILPWTLLARFPALWIAWLAIVNLAMALYFVTFGMWGVLFAPQKLMWLLFGVNTAALVIWEGLAAAGIAWLRERWSPRILATASGGLITALAFQHIIDWRFDGQVSQWGAPLWLAWIVAAYFVYRHWVKDLYVLAGGVLSVIVVATTFIAKHMAMREAGAFLVLGMLVIGMSAAGGYWLKQVAAEEEDA
jgi:uncharacterized membrane protein